VGFGGVLWWFWGVVKSSKGNDRPSKLKIMKFFSQIKEYRDRDRDRGIDRNLTLLIVRQ
jgi:hypothetical protein